MAPPFRRIEGWAGDLTPSSYADGGVTHLAYPVRCEGASAEIALEAANRAAAAMRDAAEQIDGVVPITSPLEGAYALIANTATAVAALSTKERVAVLSAARLAGTLAVLVDALGGA